MAAHSTANANGDFTVTRRPLSMVTPVNTVDPQFQGNKEIDVAVGLFHAKGSNVGSFSGDVRFGYYVLPRPSLGVHQSQTYHFIDDGPETWLASTVPFIEYSCGHDKVRPCLGTLVGGVYNDDEGSGTFGGRTAERRRGAG